MEVLHDLALGFANVLTPANMLVLLAGILIGNAVGVIPGLGPAAGAALVLPLTYFMPTDTAVFMLAAVYYGSMYGGSTTGILLNIPGEPAATLTTYEGHKLRLKGRGAAALSVSALSSFVGGTVAVVGLMFMSVPLARFGLKFGPAETFSLILMAFTMVGALSGSPVRGLAMAALGMCLATVGQTTIVAGTRLTFGFHDLDEGFSIVAAAIGLFAIPEVLNVIESGVRLAVKKGMINPRDLVPTREEWRDTSAGIPTGTLVGFFGGVLPGAGATVSTFLAYGVQRRISRRPEKFGNGSMEAVAAAESANNAASTGALVPMLSLGIPGSATAAVILGALVLHGVQPGPLLLKLHPEVFWGLVASMYLGNVALILLAAPLIAIWITLLRWVPNNVIMAAVLAVSALGVYADDNTTGGVFVMLGFGILGYIMNKLDFPIPPLILALILTPQMETNLMRALSISHGDWTTFLTRPLSLGLLLFGIISVALQLGAGSKLKAAGRYAWRAARGGRD